MKKIIQLLSILLLVANLSKAQDIHFSQMEFSPLNLNPALAGANHDMQGIINYRNQWKAVGDPFSTIGASFDARIKQAGSGKKGFLGVGVNFFNDKAGSPRMNSTNASLNVSYHVYLDGNNTFGAGLYTGFGQRSLDPLNGKWANQFDGVNYDANLVSGESFASERFAFFDIGGGVLYTYKKDEKSVSSKDQIIVNAGAAFFHGNRPNYSFINRADETLPMRYSVFANSIIGFESSNLNVMPGLYYQRQGKAQEILVGSYVGFVFQEASKVTGYNKNTMLALGAFYRNKDAIVLKSMFEWSGYTFGLAYDINVSSLSEASRSRGGVEFFLRYIMETPSGKSKSRI
jgi:type IX secretion system PorP/SprF family membrane protein